MTKKTLKMDMKSGLGAITEDASESEEGPVTTPSWPSRSVGYHSLLQVSRCRCVWLEHTTVFSSRPNSPKFLQKKVGHRGRHRGGIERALSSKSKQDLGLR